MRPAFPEDRVSGRYTPGRGTRMRQSAALAGSLLLNLLLLAGVVAAMRGPDLLAPGVRSALVTVSMAPEPRKTAPPPPPAAKPETTQAATAGRPLPEPSPAPVLLPKPGPAPASTSAPAAPQPKAEPPRPAAAAVPRPEPRPAEASASQIDAYRQQLWQSILAARPRGTAGTGTVTIRFRIDRSGALVSAAVTGSSGQFMLDRTALQAVRKAAPFPAPPADMDDAALTFTVPVNFHR